MTTQKINARTLITDLLLASEGKIISIKEMILAAKLFGISENGIRVA
ncbi:PaaX family transcriptional regulator, partial [Acinetobacter baumannii]|nr:PaaX family transcriptional regulator [Acinetobacter baumannii]